MQASKQHTAYLIGFGITFLGAILFSTKAIMVKLAFQHARVDALTLLTLRMLFSLPFYAVAAWLATRSPGVAPLSRQQWIWVILLGLFGYYLSSLFDFMGLQYISAGLERLILFLYPTFAVLLNAAVFKERVTGMQKAALVITYLGIALAFWGELQLDLENPHFYKGCLLVFACAVTFSVYLAGSGQLIPVIGPTRFTAYAILAATGGIFLHFVLAGNGWTVISDSRDSWGYGLLLAIVATVVPTFMFSAGVKRIGSNNAAIISGIGPVSTILQAHWILGEDIFAEQVIGTALVVAGVLMIGWKRNRSE
ncbi:MAG: DMT family transporter [Candidatus Pseudobacter hemicellulosilyticus]|uniref:DMT family transporter n=1 Tax=Candidatus Pseudobacter hemicellulosilyticus TaxID=3121375 RepID=A0AAJ5WVP4_9BACT|nr:MAG: DMT family transporter [Pseudobacter sp.]